jgi:hypothetical protein
MLVNYLTYMVDNFLLICKQLEQKHVCMTRNILKLRNFGLEILHL